MPKILDQAAAENKEYLAHIFAGEAILRRLAERMDEIRMLAANAGVNIREDRFPKDLSALDKFIGFLESGAVEDLVGKNWTEDMQSLFDILDEFDKQIDAWRLQMSAVCPAVQA